MFPQQVEELYSLDLDSLNSLRFSIYSNSNVIFYFLFYFFPIHPIQSYLHSQASIWVDISIQMETWRKGWSSCDQGSKPKPFLLQSGQQNITSASGTIWLFSCTLDSADLLMLQVINNACATQAILSIQVNCPGSWYWPRVANAERIHRELSTWS